jgi:hypothetical protein
MWMLHVVNTPCAFIQRQRLHGVLRGQEDTTEHHVKDLDVMMGSCAAALILDDTEGVWPPALRGNLITAPRYIWFPADHARFRLPGDALMTAGIDEDPAVGLDRLLQVLYDSQIHLFHYLFATRKLH